MDEEGTAGREGWWMRKNRRKERLLDEEGTAGREGWWMRKVQQEGKAGG